MSVSVLILTLNEEANLPGCLDSIPWADDIVVYDSFSTDRTCEVARDRGCRVVQRKFDNWAAHQNWAMEHVPFKHPWVFYLDADERMTDELRDEIRAVAANPAEPRVAFYCGRKNFFMGRWIRRCYPPGMIMRFFKPPYVRFERLVNPTPVVAGEHGYLKHRFVHYNFSKGLNEWFEKHNKYSLAEAMEGMRFVREEPVRASLRKVFSGDAAVRRKGLKELSFHAPFRGTLRFLLLYVLKFGFLDGRAGFEYCRMIAVYEYMIEVKMTELRLREKGLPL